MRDKQIESSDKLLEDLGLLLGFLNLLSTIICDILQVKLIRQDVFDTKINIL